MPAWTYDGLAYRRRVTRTVRIGNVEIGSDHPVRVQSMTTPSTRDTPATVTQIERLVDAGCEIVRLTVPTNADAENLPTIREELKQRGIHVPLVADIHFTPRAAMKAVEYVEKVRINPGNYADKKKFNVREYSDAEYAAISDLPQSHQLFKLYKKVNGEAPALFADYVTGIIYNQVDAANMIVTIGVHSLRKDDSYQPNDGFRTYNVSERINIRNIS